MSEDHIGCKDFTIISINSLIVSKNKYYLQVYLRNCADKMAEKRKIIKWNDKLWQILKLMKTSSYKGCIMTELIYTKGLVILKVTEKMNAWFTTISFLIMVQIVIICMECLPWQFCVLI